MFIPALEICWLEVIDKEEAWKQLPLACEYSFLGARRANVKSNFWFQHPRDFSSKLAHIQRSMGGVAFNDSTLRAYHYSFFRSHAHLEIMPLSGFIVVSTN